MGFDYEIQYRSGSEYVAADALSRVQGAEILLMAISVVSSDLKDKIVASYELDAHLMDIIQKLQDGQQVLHYTLEAELLRKKDKIVVGPAEALRIAIINWQHTTPEREHLGRDLTVTRLRGFFYWKRLAKHTRQFIMECVTCQASKCEPMTSPGLMQPLSIPEEVCVDISMDFITRLSKSNGKEVIYVVVDRLSKATHCMALTHPFSALQVAQVYLDHVFKLHGWSKSIVSDKDSVFLSQFCQGLFSLHGSAFHLSLAYHPQSDGQTEVVNRCLEMYLRYMCGENSKDWCIWLPLAEWWYNTHYHTFTQLTPYECGV